jgi:hypothetical protein
MREIPGKYGSGLHHSFSEFSRRCRAHATGVGVGVAHSVQTVNRFLHRQYTWESVAGLSSADCSRR